MSLNKTITNGLELTSSGVGIATAGVTTARLADAAVTQAKLSGSNLNVSGTVNAAALTAGDDYITPTADAVINGIANGFEGRYVEVLPSGGTLLSAAHLSASAAASDQLVLVNAEDMPPTVRGALCLRYESGKWREVGRGGLGPNTRATAATAIVNSTSQLTWASLTIPANTLVAGSTFEIYGAMAYSRGATATASNLSWAYRIGGVSTNLNDTRATVTTNGGSGYVFVRGLLWCGVAGASGELRSSIECNYNIDNTERRLFSHGLLTAVDTTASIAVDMRSNFSVAVPSLSQTIGAGLIRRVA